VTGRGYEAVTHWATPRGGSAYRAGEAMAVWEQPTRGAARQRGLRRLQGPERVGLGRGMTWRQRRGWRPGAHHGRHLQLDGQILANGPRSRVGRQRGGCCSTSAPCRAPASSAATVGELVQRRQRQRRARRHLRLGHLVAARENITAGGGAGVRSGQAGTSTSQTSPASVGRANRDFFHGTERLSWFALGCRPTADGADRRLRLGAPGRRRPAGLGSTDWDTTGVPDSAYELRITFRTPTVKRSARRPGSSDQQLRCLALGPDGGGRDLGSRHRTRGRGRPHGAVGVTLAIEPGAVIKFANGTRITLRTAAS